jgi:hypothetical protein
MNSTRLIQSLFSGALDILADVHGEFDALLSLLAHLGYAFDGQHPEGRRLVFLGDLTDRGPDSPAVVDLVQSLVSAGLAQCVLGNHELNLLRGQVKHGNGWYHGRTEALDKSGRVVPQVLADDAIRERCLSLFRRLPLALEREDLRVVHACWEPALIDLLREETEILTVFQRFRDQIEAELSQTGTTEKSERDLALQNRNPVKVVNSGLERRAPRPYYAGGKVRSEERVPWWDAYNDEAWCVFGHYWRQRLPSDDGEYPFGQTPLYSALGNGRAMCIDYSAGKRWMERAGSISPEEYRTALAALRWPEKILVFDSGKCVPLAAR